MSGCINPADKAKAVQMLKALTNSKLFKQHCSGIAATYKKKFTAMEIMVIKMILKALLFIVLLFFSGVFSPGPGRFRVQRTERQQKSFTEKRSKFRMKK